MEQKLTHHDTLVLQQAVKIDGDLLLLPEQAPLPIEEARALETAGLIKPNKSSIYRGVYDVIALTQRYNSERHDDDSEPDWVKELPMSVRTWLRVTYALTQEDPIANVPGFPFTGLSYVVLADGLCEEVCRQFKIWRLGGIKQLGFLNQPTYNNYIGIRQSLSESTRELHSYDTMTIGTLIGHNLGYSGGRMHTLRTLLLAHDAATPAGGDSVKLVDPRGLDEDENFKDFLRGADFTRLGGEYDVNKEDLLTGIRNEGLDGEILDIADKLAYIARDISKCLHHLEAGADQDQLGLRSLLSLLNRFPYVCSVWDGVEEQSGHAVFTSIPRLVAFLKIRLLMFRELYYHPTARFGEFLMSRLFVKALYQKGTLTRGMLLTMSDYDLVALLDKEFGSGAVLDTCSSEKSRCSVFRSMEEAAMFIDKIRKCGNKFWMLDDNRRAIKTGANLRVKGPSGALTLEEADPGVARELHEMATMLPLVHVYWLEGDPALSQGALTKLKESLYA